MNLCQLDRDLKCCRYSLGIADIVVLEILVLEFLLMVELPSERDFQHRGSIHARSWKDSTYLALLLLEHSYVGCTCSKVPPHLPKVPLFALYPFLS